MIVRKFEGTRADLKLGDEFSDGNDRSRPRYKITVDASGWKQFSVLEHWGPMYTLSADKVSCTIWREEPDRCCTCANDYPVSVEQIREFVIEATASSLGMYQYREKILGFIDNGPKKKTAEEVAYEAFCACPVDASPDISRAMVSALREVDHIDEDA